jgi:hypothetical protein
MFSSTLKQRVFCKGVIENCGKPDAKFWNLNLGTNGRAQDLYRILRNCGVNSEIVGMSNLKVNRWGASLDLDTSTNYPTEEELGEYDTTSEAKEEFVFRMDRKTSTNRGSKETLRKKFFYVIYERCLAGLPVSPCALRAAWYSTGFKHTIPIYDAIPIENVEPIMKKLDAIYVKTPQLEVDGLIASGV